MDIHPLKLVYDNNGEAIAISEYTPGDTIPQAFLNLNANVDGGSISDKKYPLLEAVDGGVFSDTYISTETQYDGGTISRL